MEQFDTLPIQYRHIEHMHEGVWLKKKYDEMTAVRTYNYSLIWLLYILKLIFFSIILSAHS